MDDPDFFRIGPRTIVSGYFQSLFYLTPRDDEILSELDLSAAASPPALELVQTIRRGNYVSVHVRRGDYLNLPRFHHIDYACYAAAAMEFVRRRVGCGATFLIFSNDIQWCKTERTFARNCEFIEANRFSDNPAVDLLLMSACRHHIVANSTYSWWAAWARLDDESICVLPKMWVADRTTEDMGLVYPKWVSL
jgi:hypothetical protein